VNIKTTSNHVHELANQANELTEDELNHVSGGSLSYGAIEWTYTKQKPDGTAAGNVAAKWSLAQGAVS
jgi:bacteriocin-like protein